MLTDVLNNLNNCVARCCCCSNQLYHLSRAVDDQQPPSLVSPRASRCPCLYNDRRTTEAKEAMVQSLRRQQLLGPRLRVDVADEVDDIRLEESLTTKITSLFHVSTAEQKLESSSSWRKPRSQWTDDAFVTELRHQSLMQVVTDTAERNISRIHKYKESLNKK